MLLSERELELSDEHTGIIELSPDAKVGSPAAKALGLDDAVFHIAITPNRPDCLGVRGIARDLAAAGLGKLKKDTGRPVKGGFANPIGVALEFDKQKRECLPGLRRTARARRQERPLPRMAATAAEGDRASPDQRARRSHQLHFLRPRPPAPCLRRRQAQGRDPRAARAQGREIPRARRQDLRRRRRHVRHRRRSRRARARRGDRRRGLRASPRRQPTSSSSSAYFDPRRTARTGRKLGIQSDARFRFERGVDPDFVVPGLELATDLVLQICGGSPSKITVAGKPPKPTKPFKFDLALVKRISGLDLGAGEIKRLLAALGVTLDGKGKHLNAAPPSWRPDITAPADLVEEVVRLTGVDKVPATPMRRAPAWRARCSPRRRGGSGSPGACSLRAGWSRP